MNKEEIKIVCKALMLTPGKPVFWCYPDTDIIVDKSVELSYKDAEEKGILIKQLEHDMDKLTMESAKKEEWASMVSVLSIIEMIDKKVIELSANRTHEESKLQISLNHEIKDLDELKAAIKIRFKVV